MSEKMPKLIYWLQLDTAIKILLILVDFTLNIQCTQFKIATKQKIPIRADSY